MLGSSPFAPLSLVLLLVLVHHATGEAASPRAIKLDVNHSRSTPTEKGLLTINCTLDASLTDMDTVATLAVFGSRLYGSNNEFEKLATVDMWSKSPKLSDDVEDSDVDVRGDTGSEQKKQAYLLLSWNSPTNVLRRSYRCVANGIDSEGQGVSVYTTVKDESPDGGCCPDMEPVTSALESLGGKVNDIPRVMEEVAEGVVQTITQKIERLDRNIQALQQSVQRQFKILAINKANYDVSSVYNGRVYLASKRAAAFNIQAANRACVASGGYLVEFDGPAEYSFVYNFVKTTGGANSFWTGGNDIAAEGKFVYYHSKKPVTGLTWVKNQPDGLANEDCMEIRLNFGGLNDWVCNKEGKYVCEVPLV